MAIVINANPGANYSAHGDLIFTVYESVKANDPVTYPDYKYVADIYVGGTLVARLKAVPQPDNKRGVFNIGNIVRNYLATTFNPDPTAFQAQQLGLAEFYTDVQVKFGEEYNFTLFTNLMVDSARRYYNHYNGRLLGQNTNLTPFLNRVTSNRPYPVAVNIADDFTLLPYFAADGNPFDVVITKYGPPVPGTPVTIEWGYFAADPYATVDTQTMQFSNLYMSGSNSFLLNYTNAANNDYLVLKEPASEPLKTNWFNTTFNYGTMPDSVFRAPVVIGSFRYYVSRIQVVLDSLNASVLFSNSLPGGSSPAIASTTTITITPVSGQTMQILNVSPASVNRLVAGFVDSDTRYYTIQVGVVSIYRFDLVCEARYEVHRIHFLNKYGGFETRNFSKVSRPSIAINKSSFGKLPYSIDSSGAVVYANGNNVYNETRSTYASQYSEKLTLNTDILTDAEYVWLNDLMLSPQVYIEKEGYFISITITATNYEAKKQINDKLTNLTIDVEFGDQFNAQYR